MFKSWIRKVIQGHRSNVWSSIAFPKMNYNLCKMQKKNPDVLTSFHATLATAKASWGWQAVSAKPHEFPPVPTLPKQFIRAAIPDPHKLCHVWLWWILCWHTWRCVSFLKSHTVLVTRLQKSPHFNEGLHFSNNFKEREKKITQNSLCSPLLGEAAWSQAEFESQLCYYSLCNPQQVTCFSLPYFLYLKIEENRT